MKKITLKFLSDPGHGWLSVTHELIRKLGVADKISGYSYMTNTRAYLEEDCDAGIVLDALKEADYEIKITESHTNNQSQVRSLGSYNSDFISNPLAYGDKILLYGYKTPFVYKGFIRGENKSLVEAQGNLGTFFYTVPTRNIFKYVEKRLTVPCQ